MNNKRGQFFLVAAIIIIVIITGLATVYTQTRTAVEDEIPDVSTFEHPQISSDTILDIALDIKKDIHERNNSR